MTCSLDTYRQEVGVFAGILCKILHRKAKIAAKRIRGLRCSGFLARVTVLNLIIALLLRAGIEPSPGPCGGQSTNTVPCKENSEEQDNNSDTDIATVLKVLAGLQPRLDEVAQSINRLQEQQSDNVTYVTDCFLRLDKLTQDRHCALEKLIQQQGAAIEALNKKCESLERCNEQLRQELNFQSHLTPWTTEDDVTT